MRDTKKGQCGEEVITIKKARRNRVQTEFLIFMGITFGLTFLMAILSGIARCHGSESFENLSQPLYPAFGVILAKLLCERDEPLLPRRSFLCFTLWAVFLTAGSLLLFFLPEGIASVVKEALFSCLVFGLLLFMLFLFSEKEEKRAAYGITGGNWNAVICYILLFVILTLVTKTALAFCTEIVSGAGSTEQTWTHLFEQVLDGLSLKLLYFLVFGAFYYFLEEYGWRYYLQSVLLQRFGAVKGIALVGLLWELWHLPAYSSMAAVSGMTLPQLLLSRLVSVTLLAFFFGYVYLKTNNLWAVILLHALNNFLLTLDAPWPGEAGTPLPVDTREGWITTLLFILIRALAFLPFVFLVARADPTKDPRREA